MVSLVVIFLNRGLKLFARVSTYFVNDLEDGVPSPIRFVSKNVITHTVYRTTNESSLPNYES